MIEKSLEDLFSITRYWIKISIYGCLGQYTALIYNPNVATSITSQGRAFVASMTLHFEMFLNDNVKFGSLNETIQYINNIISEKDKRKTNSYILLNHIPSLEETFAKIILDTGYRWIPDDRELDIIWKVLENLSQEDLTRIYYKNNLFEFVSNTKVMEMVKNILRTLETPFYTSANVPNEIAEQLNAFKDLCMEYVYYRYMYIDRIDRCDNMIKSVTMISDTDSTIISVDGWYRFILENIQDEELKIANYTKDPVLDEPQEELKPQKVKDFNFITEEVEEIERMSAPDIILPNANIRYSIISILGYVLDHSVNDYMIKACENMHSVKEPYHSAKECKIYSKSEFLFKRLLMVPHVKKNYASLIEVQEGNIVPEDAQLDIKGIEALHKSSKPLRTRNALKKILLEDILKAPVIDQLKLIKDIAILEHEIVDNIRNGSREYYKPLTIKSASSYEDPMRIQGIKASIAWNFLIEGTNYTGINLSERNAIDVIKVKIDRATVDKIKDTFPNEYANMIKALDDETFKTYVKDPKTGKKDKLSANCIEAVALPLEIDLPKWLEPFIDYNSIIIDNLAGFPYESIGIQRLNKNITPTNIINL